ncbi:hypothetical protein [Streptomyces sp. CA2R106]|uniref:hypothetical protein n=1 Tax=Streptomyces sp. CA2R106 TaxID=3120153 RepID=UPI0030088D55
MIAPAPCNERIPPWQNSSPVPAPPWTAAATGAVSDLQTWNYTRDPDQVTALHEQIP